MSKGLQDAKAKAQAYWSAVDAATPNPLQAACRVHLPPAFRWQGPAPCTELHGPDVLTQEFLVPLRHAIPDLTRQSTIFMTGLSKGQKGSQA
jgi:hypothetical protein